MQHLGGSGRDELQTILHRRRYKFNLLSSSIHDHLTLFSDENGKTGVGKKETCVQFNDIQISCLSGICKNVSEVYKCDFYVSQSTCPALSDLKF